MKLVHINYPLFVHLQLFSSSPTRHHSSNNHLLAFATHNTKFNVNMSLARAFTTRRVRMSNELAEASKAPQRSNTTTKGATSLRQKISAPVQLVHTTNMLSYNAPDLPRTKRSVSLHRKSDDDNASQTTQDSTPPTSPDIEHGQRGSSPDGSHSSSYFAATGKRAYTPLPEVIAENAVPELPQRSPSHKKKSSQEILARQRSTRLSRDSHQSAASSQNSHTFSRSASVSTVASSASRSSLSGPHKLTVPLSPSTPPPMPAMPAMPLLDRTFRKEAHPFGQELAQVTELVEEFGARDGVPVMSEDDQYMMEHGLVKLNASDYLGEVHGLDNYFFAENHRVSVAPLWI